MKKRAWTPVLILDDILFAPLHGVLWLGRKIQAAVEEKLESQKQQISSSLSELYMLLDTGKITEQEFDTREKELLRRLDLVSAQLREVESDRGAAPSRSGAHDDSQQAER